MATYLAGPERDVELAKKIIKINDYKKMTVQVFKTFKLTDLFIFAFSRGTGSSGTHQDTSIQLLFLKVQGECRSAVFYSKGLECFVLDQLLLCELV
ncbi:MAG: hypothetical protein D5R98_06880 [Desulfonatronovibrio sp. MSAO_Bac4]|nr:MAG: hypothetical protein D5R98_06880 [Desulfonatronovibrio sp. MSAO_Bac4]